MKASEFVKKHGIEKARECIEEANAYSGFWVNAKTLELSKLIPSYDAVSIPDLKRLVESYELVESFNGLEMAKKFYDENIIECSDAWNLKQAIADVESCMGVNQ